MWMTPRRSGGRRAWRCSIVARSSRSRPRRRAGSSSRCRARPRRRRAAGRSRSCRCRPRRELPVMIVRPTPMRAKTRPMSAAMSSSSTTGSSGCLAWRTNATQLCLPRTWFDSCTAVRSENDSSTIAMMSTSDRQPRHLERMRVVELLDALVEREDAADREQDDRDDEGVDVALAPVAEGVLLVGLPLRLAAAEQQQQPGCRSRRASARPRRASTLEPGEEPGDELGDGDAEVREEGRDDRPRAARCDSSTANSPRMPSPELHSDAALDAPHHRHPRSRLDGRRDPRRTAAARASRSTAASASPTATEAQGRAAAPRRA